MDYEIFAFRQIFRIVQETQIFALYFHGILWGFSFFFLGWQKGVFSCNKFKQSNASNAA